MTKLTYEEEKQLNDLFKRTKGQLFMKGGGFLGPIICSIPHIWSREIPTACTNGLWIKTNPDWYLSNSEEMRVTVLAHEAWHVGLMHVIRREDRDVEDWQVACDLAVNGILHKDGYIFEGPHIHDPAFAGMSVETIYDMIHDPNKPKGSKGNVPEPNGKLGIDSHPDIMEPQDSEGKLDKLSKTQIIQMVKSATTSMGMAGNPGDIPGEVTEVIRNFLRPILPWETLLDGFFNDLCDHHRSYQRPNRRYMDEDIIMPSNMGMDGLDHLLYFLDVSGSISDREILRFNSEVKHIKETYNPKKLTLVTFDVKIRDVYVFEEDDVFEKIVVTGRGGTNLNHVVEMANKEAPNACIIFTDMRVKIPETKIKCPVIWICSGNIKATAPYGKLLHISAKA